MLRLKASEDDEGKAGHNEAGFVARCVSGVRGCPVFQTSEPEMDDDGKAGHDEAGLVAPHV